MFQRVTKLLIALLAITSLNVVQAPVAKALVTATMADTDSLNFDHSKSINIKGTGTSVGDIVLYPGVGAFGGVIIDAVVTTVSIPSGSISNYDNPGSASTATGSQNYFQVNTVGGAATFQFDFYVGGTYTVPNSGTPVYIQNLRVQSIDLDCSTAASSYQYSDFTGFQDYTLTTDTNLIVIPQSASAGVRFQANKTGSRSSVPQDQAMMRYTNVQSLKVTFGNVVAGSTNYFGLIFGPWVGGGTLVETPNVFNTPPTSTSVTQYVVATGTSVVPLSSFGNYSDADNNPFVQIKIASLPTIGTLQFNGSNATVGQTILTSDIDAGKLKLVTSSLASNSTMTFNVFDGTDYSTSTYTLTFVQATSSQTINFQSPGAQSPGTLIASGATASSGLTVTLTSLTPGICTISGLNIQAITNGTCTVVATQSGNSSYSAANPVTQSFPISSGTANTITFSQPSNQTTGATVASGATASSGLTVLLTSLTPSVCTVSGLSIVTVTAGTCTITASQPGNNVYTAASNVTRSFTVSAPAPVATSVAARTSGVGLTYSSSGPSGTVVLNGRIDANGNAITYQFCYSTSSTTLLGQLTGTTSNPLYCVNSSTAVASSTSTSTLAATSALDASVSSASIALGSSTNQINWNTNYYYQVIAWATGSSTKAYGAVVKFRTPSNGSGGHRRSTAWAAAVTSVPTTFTQTTATLIGIGVVSSTSSSGAQFCLSKTFTNSASGQMTTCDQTIPVSGTAFSNASSSTNLSVSASGLTANTVYYYQVIVNVGTTIYYGNIVSFITSTQDPVATTASATSVTGNSAILNGTINGYGAAVTTAFCWGSVSITSATCPSGDTTATATPSPLTTNIGAAITLSLSGLTPGTTYYFMAAATKSGTTYWGAVKTFMPGAPLATTLAPTAIAVVSGSTWKATLNGYMNPLGVNANAQFWYSTTAPGTSGILSTGVTKVNSLPNSSSSVTNESLTVSTLSAATTYYYQLVATNAGNSSLVSYGAVFKFITTSAPTVSTTLASSVSATSATINGTANPNSSATTPTFCVSLTSDTSPDSGLLQNCFLTVSGGTLTTNSSSQNILNALTGLTPNTTYYFQALAENSIGTAAGVVQSFTTQTLPSAITTAATSIGSTTATLNGSASASGGPSTSVTFCLASDPTTDSLGALTCDVSTPNGSTLTITGSSTTIESASVTGLTSNSIYYFQIVATNSNGTSYGAVYSFTPGVPTVTTNSVTSISATGATLNGVGNKQTDGGTVKEYLCLSSNNSVDQNGALPCDLAVSPSTTVTSSSTTITFTPSYTLNSGTKYYAQAWIVGTNGTNYGGVVSFTTNPVVTFISNGGTGSMSPQNAAYESSLTFAANSFTRSRFNFNGWNTAADGSGSNYSDSATVTLNNNLTLYAKWTSNGNIVTFNANGGTGSMASQLSLVTTNLTANSFSRTGFTFGGWSTAPGSNTVAYTNSASYSFASDITLYAIWTPVGHVVTYLGNKGTGSMETQSSSGTSNLTANTFTRTNYTFAGWGLSSDATIVTYHDGDAYAFSADLTLYAIWTSTQKIVSFFSNGGDGSMPDQLSDTITALSSNQFTKLGYSFAGWSTASDGSTLVYNDNSPFAFNSAPAQTNLYAVWGGRITYDANGSSGTVPSDSTVYSVGSAATLSDGSTLSSSGHTFSGWATDNVASNGAYPGNSSLNIYGDLTLYAMFASQVTYSTKGATAGSAPIDTSYYLDGASANILDAGTLVRDGYTFDGWTDGANIYKQDDDLVLNGNITLDPVWTKNGKDYTVTYHSNGPGSADVVRTGTTSTTFTFITNPFTYSGYSFNYWADNASCDSTDPTVNFYSSGNSFTVVSDPTTIDIYACWSLAPISNGNGVNHSPINPTPTQPTPTQPTSPKTPVAPTKTANQGPVASTNKAIIQTFANSYPSGINKIVPVQQVITVPLPSSSKVQEVLVNGVEASPTEAPIGIKIPVIVGPKDNVTVVVDNNGQTVQVPVAYRAVPISLANVNFNLASSALTPTAKKILDNVVAVMKSHGFTYIDLSGHTDVQGGTSYDNQKLSNERAAEVKLYLGARLGPNVTVVTSGHAYYEPVAKGNDLVSFATNRRVEIIVK